METLLAAALKEFLTYNPYQAYKIAMVWVVWF